MSEGGTERPGTGRPSGTSKITKSAPLWGQNVDRPGPVVLPFPYKRKAILLQKKSLKNVKLELKRKCLQI